MNGRPGGIDPDDRDALAAAGLYDPDAHDADANLELLEYLLGLGLSIPELVQASVEKRILSVAALNRLRPDGKRITLSEAAARADVDVRRARTPSISRSGSPTSRDTRACRAASTPTRWWR